MIIHNGKKYIKANFIDEEEVENVVFQNSEHFFGPSSILIPKALIRTQDGIGTIPDGFAIDLATRNWYIVEAELGKHHLWNHIAPQVTKQLLAANNKQTKKFITEKIIQMIKKDDSIKEIFADENIREINIRKVIGEILEKPPIVGMPIDSVSNDLKGWAETLKNDVRLWLVEKYVCFGNPNDVAYILPEENRPIFDTSDRDQERISGITTYDVTMNDLIDSGFLAENQELFFTYKPRGGEQKDFIAKLHSEGVLEVLNEMFNTPSYAALFCIQNAGSKRTTINGWTKWKNRDGESLALLRERYLKQKDHESEIES